MFAATRVINPGPTRIGQIGNSFTLPRTVPIVVLIACAIGAVTATLLMAAFTRSVSSLIAAAGVGGTVGWAMVSWSPLRGESLAKWAGLKAATVHDRRLVNGQMAKVYVGVAPVTRLAAGRIRIQQGHFDVAAGSVDHHGRFVSLSAVDAPPGKRFPTTHSDSSGDEPTGEHP